MRASEVFTPNVFPEHTYVSRDSSRLEKNLNEELENPGFLISIAGPSKSGKTALVEKAVGDENLITVTGAGITSPQDLWIKVIRWMGLPATASTTSQTQISGGMRLGAAGSVGLLGTGASASGDVSGSIVRTGSETHQVENANLAKIVREIGNSSFVVLIDDYHYIKREFQPVIAQELKEAVRLGVKIITATLPHHADEAIRANHDLVGRVSAIDLAYWSSSELKQIAYLGLPKLGIKFDEPLLEALAKTASGSPQLMQQILLTTCKYLGVNETQDIEVIHHLDGLNLRDVYQRAAMSTDQSSLVNRLISGPKIRGMERKDYQLILGGRGDVYKVLFIAIILDPTKLSFAYEELRSRVGHVCVGELPTGSSLIGACQHVAEIAGTLSEGAIIDWDPDHETLYVRDPYLMFYLRWSEKMLGFQPT